MAPTELHVAANPGCRTGRLAVDAPVEGVDDDFLTYVVKNIVPLDRNAPVGGACACPSTLRASTPLSLRPSVAVPSRSASGCPTVSIQSTRVNVRSQSTMPTGRPRSLLDVATSWEPSPRPRWIVDSAHSNTRRLTLRCPVPSVRPRFQWFQWSSSGSLLRADRPIPTVGPPSTNSSTGDVLRRRVAGDVSEVSLHPCGPHESVAEGAVVVASMQHPESAIPEASAGLVVPVIVEVALTNRAASTRVEHEIGADWWG